MDKIEERQVEKWKDMKNTKKSKLNSEKIWTTWKKEKLNIEKIWKIGKKSRFNSESILKLWKQIGKRYEKYGKT